jgi:hypothetical protein
VLILCSALQHRAAPASSGQAGSAGTRLAPRAAQQPSVHASGSWYWVGCKRWVLEATDGGSLLHAAEFETQDAAAVLCWKLVSKGDSLQQHSVHIGDCTAWVTQLGRGALAMFIGWAWMSDLWSAPRGLNVCTELLYAVTWCELLSTHGTPCSHYHFAASSIV